MISLKEINNKKFDKSAFGYKTDDVDDFLRDMSIEIAQLQKEKDDCEKKIEVLADKVREYMKDEEALKEALLGAQRQGHKVIEESQIIASKIIAEANENGNKIIGQTQIQLENEKILLSKMQKEVSDFKAQLLTLYKNHLDLITSMPEVEENAEVMEKLNSAENQSSEETDELNQEFSSNESKKHSYPFVNPISNANDSHHSDLKFGLNSK